MSGTAAVSGSIPSGRLSKRRCMYKWNLFLCYRSESALDSTWTLMEVIAVMFAASPSPSDSDKNGPISVLYKTRRFSRSAQS